MRALAPCLLAIALLAGCAEELPSHGAADKPKAGLRLDSKGAVLQGSKNGKVIEVGKAADSKLYEAITKPKDEDGHMPPQGEEGLVN